ncbi:MAG TPA: hypothetical protein V6C69_01750 [Trichormus sp.]|jgi:hypothetical protein
MAELENKMETFAKIIEGRVVHDEGRVQICLKGTILGFPATLEAINAGWPFGVNYFIETNVIEDPDEEPDDQPLKLTLLPRVAHGFMKIFARVLLVEARGMKLGDKKLENEFIASFNDHEEAMRFLQYPGVSEQLIKLHRQSKFSEMLVKAGSGLWLSQPVNFKSLDADLFRETFKRLGEVGQILFESF